MEYLLAFRPWVSVIMLITFIGLFIWVANPKRSKGFNEAANLPFAEDDEEQPSSQVDTAQPHKRENKQ
ncbi:hypothetical protein WH50_10570 [Pokkaliibacter plantistimulans]|uniref:Uncharacterized protein n=2 Tax=Pseudomonadota TaxID=1224 RepID=A0ABX5M0V1_9GAMM|nr:cbb3-type cytochrome c oxidase subunit 3 [Pokkaliibacter plantistimulans]PPC77215.1 CcoQ/FixQ family Cbb3-type cytochrome c oxidase assembly chaperone [Pokkaliibacter plantistimulans]PXF31358.1 hypothetical protein WH50_10570 [Pokkaliibacter plantistimulans]